MQNRSTALKIFVLSAALLSQVASANTVIADNMKQINALLKAIAADVSNPADNTQSAADAGQLIPLFQNVVNVVPDAILNLPAAQQAAATADYQNLIQQEITDATTLQKDFQTGNNADAANVLQSMGQTKVTGHQRYNP